MANVVSRTSPYKYLRSVNEPDYPETDWIWNPDLSAVEGFPPKYWAVSGDAVSLLSQAERDAIDAAEQSDRLDAIANELTQAQSVLRAITEVLVDEFNRHAEKTNAILDAIDNANNLASLQTAIRAIADHPSRSLADLRNAARNKL